ncbi:MAG: Dam family site-specific DNA-(adenine-N6)-methyltransferase [Pleurocapsa sp. MO_226.B13]|nr:Dam family site-specific DNA-(adenine-N6)-methyltransferase [Pleurocapsa sp. MO_226.B13]
MSNKPKPFVKYAGGKRKIVPEIKKLMPRQYNTYHEIFLGGGALFFDLQPKKAILSDINKELVNAYICLRDFPHIVIQLLEDFAVSYQANVEAGTVKNYYQTIRNLDRDPKRWQLLTPCYRAGRFIFLNKTCFNGLYRVNKKNQFNVPIGAYSNPIICDRDNLQRCSQALQGVEIIHRSYAIALIDVQSQDFCYADPPYHGVNFTSYSQYKFDEQEQKNLALALSQLNAKWVASNSDTDWVRDKYCDYKITEVFRNGSINSDPNRREAVKELLISN